MTFIRKELVYAALKRADALLDLDHDVQGLTEIHEFRKQAILDDDSLTKDEKSDAIMILNNEHDYVKVIYNVGSKRVCENCNLECLAVLYCEHCIRNYLKENFSNWTSGNDNIDNLIQNCQILTCSPDYITEWIPYNNLKNVEYLTKGGCSEIYLADWIDGKYLEWDSKKKILKRKGTTDKVILKKVENVEGADRSWFDETKSHLDISSKWCSIVHCYGLTRDPSNGNYMLVMEKLDTNLKKYLQQNHNQLTWKDKIKITSDLAHALYYIHEKGKVIHRDLHSGNILYAQYNNYWYISDLGFCGPIDKPLGAVYGNLPYIAPEVIVDKNYTYASDIYSIGMLMWEISTGKSPFANLDHDYNLAINIVNGMRPEITSDIPLEYKELMQQCLDADPKKRPDTNTLNKKLNDMNNSYYKSEDKKIKKNNNKNSRNSSNENNNIKKFFISLFQLFLNNFRLTNNTKNKAFNSKIYDFRNFPKPRNATEEEQEAFLSRQHSFDIPKDINDDHSCYGNIYEILKASFFNVFKEPQTKIVNNNDDIQSNYEREIVQQQQQHHQQQQQQIIKQRININHEIYSDANLHSEDQVGLEIPDEGF